MNLMAHVRPEPAATLTKAFLNAGKELGLNQDELGAVIGRNRAAFRRGGIEPEGKSGELALLLIRVYRSLYALVGGSRSELRHWMHTENHHTGGIPAEQVKSVVGLLRVLEYLDAIRGKV
ncbi:MAG: DUF2384 domain-containing protein [Gammaproteobacteria bacterium]|nr:DUF2384 domain-containing protein [Gammaproteobacteria bacterium]